jgi:hypothetical protein
LAMFDGVAVVARTFVGWRAGGVVSWASPVVGSVV